MLEESISCSPGCEINRSQQRRFHKRLKVRHRRRACPISSTGVSCLEGMYEESENVLNSTKYELFNPFEDAKFLVAADLIRDPKPSTSKHLPSRGFVKLKDLPLDESNDFQEKNQQSIIPSPSSKLSSELHAPQGPETQFGITDSEFIRFCDDVELDAKGETAAETPHNKKPIVQMILEDFCSSESSDSSPKPNEHSKSPQSETPLNRKSIVDVILEDFCSSPYVESPPKIDAEYASPVFLFRSKPIRTYAGITRRRLRRNIEMELINTHFSDDDDSFSDSSGLSVQEDLTQDVVPQLDTVDLNSSIKVCENLLQLSSYFSQTTSHNKTPQSSEEQKCRSVAEVVGDIIHLKRTSYEVTRRKSEDEFYGFSDGDSIEEFYGFPEEKTNSHEETLKELLEAEDDILQGIDCDSLCYENVQPKATLKSNMSEQEIGEWKVKSTIDTKTKRTQGEGESDCGPTHCDSYKSLPRELSHESLIKEEELFADVDLWNDNECFLNYVTQKPNVKQDKSVLERHSGDCKIDESYTCSTTTDVKHSDGQQPCAGFSTASKKPIIISVEAKRKAHEFLSKFEQAEKEQVTRNGIDAMDDVADEQPANKNPIYSEFATASKKPVAVSATAKLTADRILREFEQEEQLPTAAKLSHVNATVSSADEEQKKAEELLRDIQFFEESFEEEDKPCMKITHQSEYVFEGFKTASAKTISVSEEARRRADCLIRAVQKEEVPKEFLEYIQADLNGIESVKPTEKEQMRTDLTFEGFKTASKKPITISDAAKQKAEQLLKEVQTDGFPPELLKFIKTDVNENNSLIPVQGTDKVIFEGFKTASMKPIKISETAKLRAEQIFKEVQTADLPHDFLKCIQAEENESSPPAADKDTSKFEGFKTASKKPIHISAAAKQRAEQLLKEIEVEDVPKDFMNPESTLKIENVQGKNEKASTNTAYEQNNNRSFKRKSEVLLEEMQSPKRRISCNERSLLNDIENAPLHKTASHSDITSTKKLSKKNLLSLSKRKKYDSPKPVPKTPEKSDSSVLRCNANTTPNLQEFFDCVKTSTPRLMRTGSSKANVPHKDSSIDGDFQKINWENSSRVCKTNSFTDLNVTFAEVSPSPKQRMERLKMYGEPPPLSPILMTNKCRPSGLRRGRSLMKP